MRGSTLPARLRSGRRATGLGVVAAVLAALLGATAALAPSASGSPVLAGAADESAEWTFLIHGVLDTDNVADVLAKNLASLTGLPDVDDVNGGQSPGGVTIEVGGRMTPYVFVPESESYARELSSQSIAVREALEVAFSRLATDTPFSMGVVVADVAGNFDAAFVQEQVR